MHNLPPSPPHQPAAPPECPAEPAPPQPLQPLGRLAAKPVVASLPSSTDTIPPLVARPPLPAERPAQAAEPLRTTDFPRSPWLQPEAAAEAPDPTVRQVQEMIDELRPEHVPEALRPELVNLQITHGSEPVQETARAELAAQFDAAAENYLESVGDFLGTSEDTGMPLHLEHEVPFDKQTTGDELAEPYCSSPSATGDNGNRAAFTVTYTHLRGWLEATAQHNPAAAADFVDRVVETVYEEYDDEAFWQTIPDPSIEDLLPGERSIQDIAQDNCRDLATQIAHDVAKYADDVDVVESCSGAPFMQQFAGASAKIALKLGAARLAAPDEQGAIYQGLAEQIRTQVHASDSSMTTAQVEQLARDLPAAITGLAGLDTYLGDRICKTATTAILGLGEARTPEHEAALAALDARERTGLNVYRNYLAQTGCSPEQAQALLDFLGTTTPDGHHQSRAPVMIAANLPDDKFQALLEARPDLFKIDDVKLIAVQRLARMGQVEQALKQVDERASGDRFSDPDLCRTTGLLTIYDETGDPAVLAAAKKQYAAISKHSSATPEEHYEVGLRMHVTARKHGDMETSYEGRRLMADNIGYLGDNSHRTYMRWVTMQAHLDTGQLAQAEDNVKDISRWERTYSAGQNAPLQMVGAYLDAGRHADALRVAAEHFKLKVPKTPEDIQALRMLVQRNRAGLAPRTGILRLDHTRNMPYA